MTFKRPENWIETRLGSCLREPIRNGYSPVCPTTPTGKWTLGLGAVTEDGFNPKGAKPAPLEDPRVDGAQLEPGDIVVSRSNTRERVGLAGVYEGQPSPCSYPDLLMRVRLSEQADPRFVKACLLAPSGRAYFSQAARGTSGSMVKIDRAILEAFPLLLPPLTEQKKIASILMSLTETIEKTEAVISHLRSFKLATLEDLLTHGLPGRHSTFVQTELGPAPETWGISSLGLLATFVTSGSRGWAQYYSSEGALFLRITNLTREMTRLDLGDQQRVSLPPSATEGARTRVEPGDVLISITADLGIISVIPLEGFEEAYVNQHIALVRLNQQKVHPEFVAAYLTSPSGQRQFSRLNDAGAKAGLNLSNIRDLLLPLPGYEEQAEIAAILKTIDDRLISESATRSNLYRLKSALRISLLSGELLVPLTKEAT